MGEVMMMQSEAMEHGGLGGQGADDMLAILHGHATQKDDLCNAISLVALLRHVGSQDGDIGDDARHGLFLVGCQVEDILAGCIEREEALRGKIAPMPQA